MFTGLSRRVLVVALLLFAYIPIGASDEHGSAKGVVVDEKGKPVGFATVYAYAQMDMTKQIRTTSNALGSFTLDDLPDGSVYIDAYKEGDGYPYNFFSFFRAPGSNTPVEVEIQARKVISGVVLHMGLRAASLKLDIINDEGAPVSGTLAFDRTDMPGPYKRAVNSGETILVPPVPFRLTFEAPGYLVWHYGGGGWQGTDGLIKLSSGETRLMTIHVKHA